MEGSLKLFNDILDDQNTTTTVARKGRSDELIAQRNECLIDRYHYYLTFTDKRYIAILEILSREFFIAAVTIQERINENYNSLVRLKNEKPAKTHFIKKWPHLVW